MAYRMTPARRAALKRAQAASARKRKKGLSRKTKRRVAIGAGLAAGAAVGAVVYTNRGGPIGRKQRYNAKANDYAFKSNVSRRHSRKSSGKLKRRFEKNAMRYARAEARYRAKAEMSRKERRAFKKIVAHY